MSLEHKETCSWFWIQRFIPSRQFVVCFIHLLARLVSQISGNIAPRILSLGNPFQVQ